MSQQTVFVAFRNSGLAFDEYLAAATSLQGAQGACAEDQAHMLSNWDTLYGANPELTRPTINLVWQTATDGTTLTTNESNFVYDYDQGYSIQKQPLRD